MLEIEIVCDFTLETALFMLVSENCATYMADATSGRAQTVALVQTNASGLPGGKMDIANIISIEL